ncbi:hypothetical protein HY628_03240, partial [Candidatus Uhrbacteria bacterium]|nr:hypothetical protein [Candidatus Uhrbacteria bacterium]
MRPLRLLIWIVALQFLWLALALLFVPQWFPNHHIPLLVAFAFVSTVCILLPEYIFRFPKVRAVWNGSFRNSLAAAVAMPLMLSWLGAFRWYRAGWGYDSLVHFLSSLIGVFISFLVILLARGSCFFRRRYT